MGVENVCEELSSDLGLLLSKKFPVENFDIGLKTNGPHLAMSYKNVDYDVSFKHDEQGGFMINLSVKLHYEDPSLGSRIEDLKKRGYISEESSNLRASKLDVECGKNVASLAYLTNVPEDSHQFVRVSNEIWKEILQPVMKEIYSDLS